MKRFFLAGIFTAIIVSSTVSPLSHAAVVSKPFVVSIGDSVAGGTGLPGASGTQNELCLRSKQAYPYAVARDIGASKILAVACNGAKLDEGIYGSQDVDGTAVTAQLDKAFAHGKPDVMLVTIGANDMRWRLNAGKCFYETCATKTDRLRTNAYLGDVYYELNRMMSGITARSGGERPQIYISGYYNPLDDTSCLDPQAVTETERQWLNTQVTRLNNALRRTAELYQDVTFVPIDFSGHGLCSSDPWLQPISRTNPGALHPTAAGQRAIADEFVKVIN